MNVPNEEYFSEKLQAADFVLFYIYVIQYNCVWRINILGKIVNIVYIVIQSV